MVGFLADESESPGHLFQLNPLSLASSDNKSYIKSVFGKAIVFGSYFLPFSIEENEF